MRVWSASASPKRVDIGIEASHGGRILVAHGLGQPLVMALRWIAVAGIGFAAGLTGLVVLIVAWIRRRDSVASTGGNGPAGPDNRQTSQAR